MMATAVPTAMRLPRERCDSAPIRKPSIAQHTMMKPRMNASTPSSSARGTCANVHHHSSDMCPAAAGTAPTCPAHAVAPSSHGMPPKQLCVSWSSTYAKLLLKQRSRAAVAKPTSRANDAPTRATLTGTWVT